MTYAVVRIRGGPKIRGDIKDTLAMLQLRKPNHCVLLPETATFRGMLQKVKDYVTWGEVEPQVVQILLTNRGRLPGGKALTEAALKGSEFKGIKELTTALTKGEAMLSAVPGLAPVFRLNPPRRGYEGIKRTFVEGGALGYRGKAVNRLLERMLAGGAQTGANPKV